MTKLGTKSERKTKHLIEIELGFLAPSWKRPNELLCFFAFCREAWTRWLSKSKVYRAALETSLGFKASWSKRMTRCAPSRLSCPLFWANSTPPRFSLCPVITPPENCFHFGHFYFVTKKGKKTLKSHYRQPCVFLFVCGFILITEDI